MNFFAQQERAHQATKWLVLCIVLATVLTIGLIYLLVAAIFALQVAGKIETLRSLWFPGLFAGVSLGTLFIVLGGAIIKMIELRGGGAAVAISLGGVPLDPHTIDPDEIKVRHVVEEMSIASGVPVPQIYLLPRETGINAFAAGYASGDAVIAVTRGCAKKLTRDELQGVVAHEFSHILNGDMRLNLRLLGLVSGIIGLSLLGQVMLRLGGEAADADTGKIAFGLAAIGLIFLVVGSIGGFFGSLIKAAVSRQREFLADASAVQFTRNPMGLASALKKIGGLEGGSRLLSHNATEASHFFFSNGLRKPWFNLLATHPPLEERIRLLDPSFDGRFPAVPEEAEETAELQEILPRAASPVPALPVPPPLIFASQMFTNAGQVSPAQFAAASGMRASFSDRIRSATRTPFEACALVYALLLSDDESVRARQESEMKPGLEPHLFEEAVQLALEIAPLTRVQRLVLVDFSLPALRQLSRDQFENLSATVRRLVESDHEVSLFEFALQKSLLRHLSPAFEPVRKSLVEFYVLKPVVPQCAVLLSALAYAGCENAGERAVAFAAGAAALKIDGDALHLLGPDEIGLDQVDAALDQLNRIAPVLKKRVLDACAHAVAADGVVQENEAGLLRAIADALDCPRPPMVACDDAEAQAAGAAQ